MFDTNKELKTISSGKTIGYYKDQRRCGIYNHQSMAFGSYNATSPIQLFAAITGIVVIIICAVYIAPVFARDFLWMIP